MYMPGRSRTGSRPSRTVMSFAEYVALVMKKALQLPHFRADVSLAGGAAVSGGCEAHPRSFFYRFAEIFGVDRGGPLVRLARLLERGLRQRCFRRLRSRGGKLRKRSRSEPQARRGGLRGRLAQALRDLALELLELEGPGRRSGVHEQRPVAGEPRRPRVRGHGLPDGSRPGGDELGHQPRPTAEAGELALDLTAEPLDHVTSLVPSACWATSSVWAGSPGNALRLALVISAWPEARTRSARIRRRSGSSSERTSSSSSSGRVPRRSSSSSASPSSSASTARRCSPCEPNVRRSRPAESTPRSSRCGPTPVAPRSRSRSRRRSSSSTLGGSPS